MTNCRHPQKGGSLLGKIPTPPGIMSAALSANEHAVFSLMALDEERGLAAWVPIYTGQALQPSRLVRRALRVTLAHSPSERNLGAEVDVYMAGDQVAVGADRRDGCNV